MTNPSESDRLLTGRIRAGEPDAWNELIARFEGRLLAFIESRVRSRAVAEDVVQEAFIGFLTSLPNYDERRPLEGFTNAARSSGRSDKPAKVSESTRKRLEDVGQERAVMYKTLILTGLRRGELAAW